MKKPTKKKEPQTAASLGKRGGLARARNLTPEQRSASARHAVLTRYGKTKPPSNNKWYGVVVVPLPEDFQMSALDKILDASNASPNVILWTRDRDAARAEAREVNTDDKTAGFAEVVEVDYDPTHLTLKREFKPDTEAQLRALKVISDGGRS